MLGIQASMSVKKTRYTYLLMPSRQWISRATLALLIATSLTLMIMSKTGNPAVTRLRTQITDIVTPVLAVAASPMDVIYNGGNWLREIATLRSENLMLKNQNIELLKWQAAAKAMESENQSLRTLLNVVPNLKTSYITAHVVSDLGGPYVHSALIDGGNENGIRKDEAVVSDHGLLGRVIEAGDSSARVLLLNDINSRVPVVAERAQEKSILMGNNIGLPTLSYLSADSKISVGDRIVTSGDGGVFPQGIPVGVVTSVDRGTIKVQPFVDPARVEYVSVLDFSL
jgi:rod shape-determining protein MreC